MNDALRGYRPEIDGLRAIAVTSVVAYHVGIPGVTGGFVGVDVFFVISGFLITGLLLKEIEQRGTIDLPGFFARRARRLLPAFFLVVAVTLLSGAFFLLPLQGEQNVLAVSATHALLYVSNFYFARGVSYFDPPVEASPFLHTWSLALEEQFYLVWPLLLLLMAFAARRWGWRFRSLVIVVLIVLSAASLAYSTVAAAHTTMAVAGFFLLQSRAWELGAGALLALAVPLIERVPRQAGELMSAAGVLAIASAVFLFDGSMPFPGATALLPVFGAVAVIAGGVVAPNALVVRGLASAPAVSIGLVSYGWYLWHWPLMAIARATDLGQRDLLRDGLIALVALALAYGSYRFFEEPIRHRRVWGAWSSRQVLKRAAVASLVLIATAHAVRGLLYVIEKSPGHRFARLIQAEGDFGPHHRRCNHGSGYERMKPLENCTHAAPPGRPTILLWGDSHAAHWTPTLEAAADEARIGVVQRTSNNCPPLLSDDPAYDDVLQPPCKRFNRDVLKEIDKLKPIGLSAVVLSARWSPQGGQPGITMNVASRERRPKNPLPLEDAARGTIAELARRGLKVLVIAPGPEQRFRVPGCLARRDEAACSTSRAVQDAYRGVVLRQLQHAVQQAGNARLFDPFDVLCTAQECPVVRDGKVIYRDAAHLAAWNARFMAPWLQPYVQWLSEPMLSATPAGTKAAATTDDSTPRP
jgi:peptidoglycan/LPS O-acetylase OafA/YrhL